MYLTLRIVEPVHSQVVPETIQKMLPLLTENFWDFFDKEPHRVGPMMYGFSKAVGAHACGGGS